ncbi:MAG: DUF368 domain-containing protein [Bacillota bacterium]|jgi:putative membrane protein
MNEIRAHFGVLSNFIRGLVIGAVMLIPGVSGGTIAIICGIYDKLLEAVANLRKNPKKNILLLTTVAVGGLIGMVLFSKPMLFLMESFTMPTMYFFIGAILGSLPILLKCAGVQKFSFHVIIWPLIGLGCLLLFSLIPQTNIATDISNYGDYLYLFICGVFLAIALILPGISFSYMALLLGIYERSLLATQNLEIIYLLVLGIGLVIGILLTAKIFQKALTKYPKQAYLLIIGFILVSMKDVFPGLPQGGEFLSCIIAGIAGFLIIFLISKRYSR